YLKQSSVRLRAICAIHSPLNKLDNKMGYAKSFVCRLAGVNGLQGFLDTLPGGKTSFSFGSLFYFNHCRSSPHPDHGPQSRSLSTPEASVLRLAADQRPDRHA